MADDPSQAQGMDPAGVNLPLIGQDEIQRRRAMAQAMMARGVDYSPVQSWTQGMARLADAAVGAYGNYSAGKLEQKMNQADLRALAPYLGGATNGSPTPLPTPSPLPPTAPPPVSPTPPAPTPPAPSPEPIPQATIQGTPGFSMMPTPGPSEDESAFTSHASVQPVNYAGYGKKLDQYGNPVPGSGLPPDNLPGTPMGGRTKVAQAMTAPPTAQSSSPTGQPDPRALLALAMRGGRLSPIASALLAKQMEPQYKEVPAGGSVVDLRSGKSIYTAPGGPSDLNLAREKAKAGAEGRAEAAAEMPPKTSFDDETLHDMAEQYVAGDKSVVQNLGRGAQGQTNIAALRKMIYQVAQEQGLAPAQIATKIAEFSGLMGGERVLGTRTANVEMAVNEASNMMPLVLQASDAVDRTKYPALNTILLAGEQGTGDPNVVRLGVSINSLVNIYARAVSPTGVPTEGTREHARELLSAAWSKGQIRAAVDQMSKEMEAARLSPGQTREEFRQGYGVTQPSALPPGSALPGLGGQSSQNDPLGIR